MKNLEINKELMQFIKSSPSMFHSIDTIEKYLKDENYIYLSEGSEWSVEKGKNYYTTRNNSSIIAFQVGDNLDNYHFQMSAAHSDSPTYKVKSEAELAGPNEYLRINTEGYGGMIDSAWFDKPLGLAGRVLVETENGVESKLLHIDKDILLIPNVPIHLNRDVNKGYEYNRQVDLMPMFSNGQLKKGDFDTMIAEFVGVDTEKILARDIFLVNNQRQTVWGYRDEFLSSPKLDDLQCAFASLKGFIGAKNPSAINVYTVFDNEEVGSNTKQGAMSTFLKDTLERLNNALGKNLEDYHRAVSKSFLVSCDNAHALHPNHPEKYDQTNRTMMNKGIVIKESANQKYTTDAFSRAVFKAICNKAGVPTQSFANRSDMVGGSTLGNLSNTQVSVHAVDIGIAQLGMHSNYETCGSEDTLHTVNALKEFFNTNIDIDGAKGFKLK